MNFPRIPKYVIPALTLWFALVIAVFPAFGSLSEAGDPGGDSARLKLYLEESGVYALTFDDLVSDGFLSETVLSKDIGMTHRDQVVPLWVEDGGDGVFGQGDRVIFVGKRLRGDYSYLDEYSRLNCYFLDWNAGEPLHGLTVQADRDREASDSSVDLFVQQRLEHDTLMVRYPERPGEPQERWYWSRLSVVDKAPFRLSVALDGILHTELSGDKDAQDLRELTIVGASGPETEKRIQEIFGSETPATATLDLRIGLRGWSKPRNSEGLSHHEVTISANGKIVSTARWDGSEPYVHHVEVPIFDAATDRVELEIRVPRRRLPESGDLFVDVVLLNWIEMDYPRESLLDQGQSRFETRRAPGDDALPIDLVAGGSGWLYGSGDQRFEVAEGNIRLAGRTLGEGPFFSVIGDAYRRVEQIVPDIPSFLKTSFRQTDYVMITHGKLLDAVQPLADFHRERGLSVAVVNIEDIYDEFNFGIQHPRSLRDFLKWASENWPEPRLRFVLLAGDASWDFKNLTADDARYADWTFRPGEARNFVKNSSSSYKIDAGLNNRNLVPTWGYRTSQGHAASDNWFVSIDGDDIYPDLAIGRIPVTEPEEMAAVVQKTIAYAGHGAPGEWRKHVLFITNESKGFQRASDTTAELYEKRGYLVQKIYPSPEEKANEEHTQNIVKAFDEGLSMIQFLGHGGRYIWRTGPPDLKKNHDLFTLDHLDTLAPNEKLPFVISLTCYSAPFDHPTADSIGEKLLRLPGSGAIGVFAASWRNSPSSSMGRIVMDELSTPGATVGEAVMRAKHRLRNPTLVETYNLLGDPAIRLNLAPDVEPPAPEDDVKQKVRQQRREAKKSKSAPAETKGLPSDGGQCAADADRKEQK